MYEMQNNTLCAHFAKCGQSAVCQKFKLTVHIHISRHKILFGLVLLFFLIAFIILVILLIQPKHEAENELNKRPLLTIFTTFAKQSDSRDVQFGYEKILRNWASFPFDVHPVLFVDAESDWDLVQTALTLNWSVLPSVKRDDRGHPILKEMYRAVYRSYTSMLYGYASDDLLFDDSLVSTLRGVYNSLHLLEYNVLLTGKWHKSVAQEYAIQNEHTRQTTSTQNQNLPTSIDTILPYLFFTRKGCLLNWLTLPDMIVVRRAGFLDGSTVVAVALQDGVNVIDATETLSLKHVFTSDQNKYVPSMDDAVETKQFFNFDVEIRLKTAKRLDSKVSVVYT